MKVVHVQLADERGEVVVLEVAWKNLLCEFVCLVDHKAVSVWVPVDCCVIFWVLAKNNNWFTQTQIVCD